MLDSFKDSALCPRAQAQIQDKKEAPCEGFPRHGAMLWVVIGIKRPSRRDGSPLQRVLTERRSSS